MADFREILVFKHMPSQNPGIFREFAADYRIRFTEIDLHAGEAIPDIARFDGLWSMGGTMNVWEDEVHPWLVEEKKVIRDVIEKRQLPFLGICLGHQLMADCLGGQIVPGKFHEVGAFAIQPTAEGESHPLLQGLPPALRWANVHTAEVSIAPAGATVLAKSERCGNHVMAFGENAYSVQFHPEVCESTLADWLKIPGIIPVLVNLLGDEGYEQFKAEIESIRLDSNRGARQLFQNWLSLVF